MAQKFRFWLTAFPDINRPIGGIKQIHRLTESLARLGYEATIVQENKVFAPAWFNSSVATISKQVWLNLFCLDPEVDIIIMPETFLPLVSAYHPNIKKIIFNQNGSYTFGLTGVDEWDPSQVLKQYSHPAIVQVWCVSQYDHSFLSAFFPDPINKVSLIINGVEPECNIPVNSHKKFQVCYMPRKNARDSSIVTSLLVSQPWFKGWNIFAIHNLDHADVIRVFQESLIFLSFGHPEGFGLPVAEAMACGCAVVGYSGLGGRELFYHSQQYQLGTSVEFGDRIAFVNGVKSVINSITHQRSDYIASIKSLSSQVRRLYSYDSMSKSVASALTKLRLHEI